MISRALVVLALLVGCGHPGNATQRSQQLSAASIVDYGARGDGSDDRAAIQAALTANAGGAVYVPAGRWTVGRAGGGYYCLSIPAGTTLFGDGDTSVLAEAAGIAVSVRLLELDAPGAVVQDLTLDDNRANQDVGVPPNAQRHGIFARARFAARRVHATNFTGDGVYGYPGSDGSTLDAVLCDGNGRNGATWQSSGGTVTGSTFRGNAAQQFDTEPGSPSHVDGMHLTGNTFDDTDGAGALISNDWALTICGSAGGQSSGWVLESNTVIGGVYVVWAQSIALHRTTIIDPTSKPALKVYRTGSAITAIDNDITATAAASIIEITGTGTGQAANTVTIAGNRLTGGGAYGIVSSGAISVVVTDNVITGRAGVGQAAIAARATNPSVPFARVEARRNAAAGYDRGISIGGVVGSPAALSLLIAADNNLGATMWLDDGSGALQRAELTSNVPDTVQRWPAGAVQSTDGATVIMTRPAP